MRVVVGEDERGSIARDLRERERETERESRTETEGEERESKREGERRDCIPENMSSLID